MKIDYVSGNDFKIQYASIAEYCKLFLVAENTPIDVAFVNSTTPIVANDNHPGSSTQVFLPGSIDDDTGLPTPGPERLFAYWDDRSPFNSIPGDDDNYGWVRIARVGNRLQAVSSATAIGGGIIAGTVTQLPDPVTAAPVIAACLLSRRHRRTTGL